MADDETVGYKGGRWLKTRRIWSPAILAGVGVSSAFRYPRADLTNFYTTTAQVVVTLYVAIAIEAIASGTARTRMDLKVELFGAVLAVASVNALHRPNPAHIMVAFG